MSGTSHPQDIDAPLHIAAQRKINSYRQQYADNQNISFSPPLSVQARPRARLSLHILLLRVTHRFPDERTPILATPLSATSDSMSHSIRGLCHSSSTSARTLLRSPSPPPPSSTQSPSPPRSLVRDGQTSPHRPRLVVSHSTCPPLSPPPTRTTLYCSNKHTHTRYCSNKHTHWHGRWQLSEPTPREQLCNHRHCSNKHTQSTLSPCDLAQRTLYANCSESQTRRKTKKHPGFQFLL